MTDPLDVLRASDAPVTPDPAFADDLRQQLIAALLADPDPSQGEAMTTNSTVTDTSAQNGRRHGDISYISLTAPDPARAQSFYDRLLRSEKRPGLEVVPQIGMSGSQLATGAVISGPVLCYRVDDIAVAVAAVRANGGRAVDPVERGYALESLASDDQGLAFYLHQLHDSPDPDGPDLINGRQHGDVAYVTIGLPDLTRAEQFYGAVLGWTFSPGNRDDSRQISGVAPMSGMFRSELPTVILSYRVDDIAAAAQLIRDLGGSAGDIAERPYGLSIDRCTDDQGIEFGLLQLS